MKPDFLFDFYMVVKFNFYYKISYILYLLF